MNQEIEEHVTKKYDIKKRLGKGVSINRRKFQYIYLKYNVKLLVCYNCSLGIMP